jgi:hypothetical protein
MPSDKLQKLHEHHTATAYGDKESKVSPLLQKLLKEPHLALFINGEWLPIVPGMIIALISDRSKVNGIAPYVLKKVSAKPGKEFVDLVAYSTNMTNARELRLGARYKGHYATSLNDSDKAQDAIVNALKQGDKE